MSQILPNLYLGSLKVAQDSKFLSKHKIRHILACGQFTYPPFPPKLIKRKRELPMKDNNIQPMMYFFWEAYDFIETAILQNENVLVHCLKGMSRSASIVVSYLLISSYKGTGTFNDNPAPSVTDALKYVQQRHATALPNKHFMNYLKRLVKELRGEDDTAFSGS